MKTLAQKISIYLTTGLVACIFSVSGAMATPISFDLAWSGDSFGNGASATGSITMDDAILLNPGNNDLISTPDYITDFSITVTGTVSGDGTWTLADYGDIIFQTDTALDLTQELIGQATSIDPWGTSQPGNTGGDFNLFGASNDAPFGTWYFELTTASGERMLMTSFAPAAMSVPEPGTLALFGLGLAGVGIIRRKRKS